MVSLDDVDYRRPPNDVSEEIYESIKSYKKIICVCHSYGAIFATALSINYPLNTIIMLDPTIKTDAFLKHLKSLPISDNHIIHDLCIMTEELAEYNYDILGHDEYPITVNTTELFNTTKAIGRKDELKIYWPENFSKLCIQPIKSSKETGINFNWFIVK